MHRYYYEIPECCLDGIHANVEKALCLRITRHDPPVQKDFEPQYFHVPIDRRAAQNPCKYCGASVFTDLKTARRVMATCKKLGSFLYQGSVHSETDGPLKCEGTPNHLEWFQYKGIDPSLIFGEKRP